MKIFIAILKKERWVSCLFLLFLLISLYGCDRVKSTMKQPVDEKQPSLVRTMVIPEGTKMENRVFPVFTKEGQSAKISFRVPGELFELNVKIGQQVKKDEIIAKLDQRDYILAVERIGKGLEEAQAGLKAMKTGARVEDIKSLESQLAAATSQLEQAEKQYKRMENLKKDGTVADVQFDMAKTTRDSVQAQKLSLEEQLKKAKSGSREEEIQMMEAKIAGLNIDLTLAKNKLKDTELKAPFDGTISEKFYDNHEMILPGLPVVSIANTKLMEATLSVPRDIVLRQENIKGVECEFSIPENVKFSARIKEIGQSVQQGTLSYPMTVIIDLAQRSGTILSGMTGTATISITGNEKTFFVPTSSIITANPNDLSKETCLWLVDKEQQTVSRKTVKVGTITDKGVTIESGLNPGDIIVTAGARFLTDGQKIRMEKVENVKTSL